MQTKLFKFFRDSSNSVLILKSIFQHSAGSNFFQVRLPGDDWSRKLPIESRMLLIQLMNIESKIVKGDKTSSIRNNTKDLSKTVSLRGLFEQRPVLDGRSTKVSHNFSL